MNVVSGLNIQGLVLNTEDNFNSIPGLVQWNDTRRALTMYDETKITSWGDRSVQPTLLRESRPDRMPVLDNGLWVKSESNITSLYALNTDYRFLHNGSKFAVYSLMKNTLATGTAITANSPFRTGSNITTGLVLTVSNASNGRFQATLRGGATVPAKEVSGFLNPAASNYTPNSSIVITACVNLGQNLGVKLRYGNAVVTLPPFFNTLAEYPTGQNGFFVAAQGQAGMTIREGMLLIYDWTGYSGANVTEFDNRVMNLFNTEKLIFENLDAS